MTGKDMTLAGNSSQILYDHIRRVLLDAPMVHANFKVGRLIVEDEQHGETRAEYGKETLIHLSKRLTLEFGRGFSRQNLQNMKQFYLCFQNCHTLSGKLSWSHYILLMRLDDEQARKDTLKEVETLQIKYSPDANALIIRLREGKSVYSIDLAEGIIAHYSKDKKILEIEILDASTVVQMSELNVSLKGAQAAVVT